MSLTATVLRRLYVAEGRSGCEIATMLGVSRATVYGALRAAGVRASQRGVGRVKRTLFGLVSSGPITAEDVADAAGISMRCASAHLSLYRKAGVLSVVGNVPTDSGQTRRLYGVAP